MYLPVGAGDGTGAGLGVGVGAGVGLGAGDGVGVGLGAGTTGAVPACAAFSASISQPFPGKGERKSAGKVRLAG